MKPFLIFQVRADKGIADDEFEAFLKYGKLSMDEVVRVNLINECFPEIDLNNYSGIIIGGGASNVSDVEHIKPIKQKQFEAYLIKVMDSVIKADFPYLGACYGLGVLGLQQKITVGTDKYSEKPGAASLLLTDEGKKDKLLKGFPHTFRTFLGHKESWQTCPMNAKLLVSSMDCPVHMVRIGAHVYATQFHPELDVESFIYRVKVYKDSGYFKPSEVDEIITQAQKETIIYPMKILERFVSFYKRE